MRMVSSCNGCRALRKGCSPDCTICPCLEWITTPEAQANATAFLAKFYGRAGLLNLIAAAPGGGDAKNRQAVFRSLIYEACGRIVNPVYGAVGLLWSGQWEKCVDAVQPMFRGELGVPVVDDAVQAADAASSEANAAPPPLGARLSPSAAAYDIRHKGSDAAAAADLLRFAPAGRAHKGFKPVAGSSSSSSSNAKLLKGGKGKARGIAKILKGMPSNNVGSLGSKLKGSKENTDAASHVIQGFQAEAKPPVGREVVAAD